MILKWLCSELAEARLSGFNKVNRNEQFWERSCQVKNQNGAPWFLPRKLSFKSPGASLKLTGEERPLETRQCFIKYSKTLFYFSSPSSATKVQNSPWAFSQLRGGGAKVYFCAHTQMRIFHPGTFVSRVTQNFFAEEIRETKWSRRKEANLQLASRCLGLACPAQVYKNRSTFSGCWRVWFLWEMSAFTKERKGG